MRRILAPVIAAALVVSLGGCKDRKVDPAPPTSTPTTLVLRLNGSTPQLLLTGELDANCQRAITDIAPDNPLGKESQLSKVMGPLLTELFQYGFVYESSYITNTGKPGETWLAVHSWGPSGGVFKADLGCVRINLQQNAAGQVEAVRFWARANIGVAQEISCTIIKGTERRTEQWLTALLVKIEQARMDIPADRFTNDPADKETSPLGTDNPKAFTQYFDDIHLNGTEKEVLATGTCSISKA